MYYLMIKEIEQTGLKYLCKRKMNLNDPEDHLRYKGSGKLWRRTLKAHPEYTVTTVVLGIFNKEDLIKWGQYYSDLYNIVESKQWANLIKELGDGGDTSSTDAYKESIKHRRKNPYNRLYKTVHNPNTGEIRRILPHQIVPNGFILGNVKGKNYGPKKDQKIVYHNGQKKIYVDKDQQPPEGFVRGLHYEGTTKGKLGYFNPTTGKKIYIDSNQSPPVGFVKGLPRTTGLKLQTPDGIFNSVQECMNTLNLTRYQIQKNIKKNIKGWRYL